MLFLWLFCLFCCWVVDLFVCFNLRTLWILNLQSKTRLYCLIFLFCCCQLYIFFLFCFVFLRIMPFSLSLPSSLPFWISLCLPISLIPIVPKCRMNILYYKYFEIQNLSKLNQISDSSIAFFLLVNIVVYFTMIFRLK